MGKYSNVAAVAEKGLHPLMMQLQGAGALGGGLYVGGKIKALLSGDQPRRRPPPRHYVPGIDRQVQKYAGVTHAVGSRMKSFNLHRRGGNYGTVQDGLDRIAKATAKHSQKGDPVV
jgi:hypothetical protein